MPGGHPLAGLGRGEDAGEVAVRGQESRGGLLADAGDAGKAVGRIAAEGGEVGVLARQHFVLRHDDRVGHDLEVAHAAGGIDHPDVAGVIDQLEEVAVAGDDVDGERRPRREGADHVVGLVLGGADDRDAERVERLADHRHLHLERIRHDFDVGPAGDDLRDPVGLVGRDQVDPPLRAPVVVPARDEVRRAIERDELRDDVEEAADRVHGCAVRCAHRVGHAVEGAEVEGCRIEEHEAVGHGIILARATEQPEMTDAAASVSRPLSVTLRLIGVRAARRSGRSRSPRSAGS